MKEYKASTGGRYTYAEDLLNMQDLALSFSSLLSGVNNCAISGCAITKLPSGNVNIASGYVWIDGKIRNFTGKNDISIASGYYIKATFEIESVKYANDASKTGREVYGALGQATLPATEQYIFINSDGFIPTIETELFGKYAVIKNPKVSNQTVNSNLTVSGNVSGNVGTFTSMAIKNAVRALKTALEADNTSIINEVGSTEKSRIKFGADGKIYFIINGVAVATITQDLCTFNATSSGASITDHIQIDGDNINLIGDSSSAGSIKVNFKGYQGGNSTNRSVDIYNGKGVKLFTFNGSGLNESFVNTQISKDGNLILKHTDKALSEEGFAKYFEISDRTGASLLKFGYWDTKNLQLNSNGKIIDVTAPSFKVSGTIFEGGASLDSKYAAKSALEALDTATVKKDGNKVLTDVNFTQALFDKLNAIGSGDVSSDNQAYVTGAAVQAAIDTTVLKKNNLSDVDAVQARSNLSVYSKSEIDGGVLKKSDNLASLADKAVSRTNLDVNSKEEVATAIDAANKAHAYSKAEADEKFQVALKDTGWVNCTQGGGVGIFNVKAKQVGNVVSIQGTLQTADTNTTWFTIPNEIAAPVNTIGGVSDMSIRDVSGNYGIKWRCDASSRNFKVAQQHGGHSAVDILITYLV